MRVAGPGSGVSAGCTTLEAKRKASFLFADLRLGVKPHQTRIVGKQGINRGIPIVPWVLVLLATCVGFGMAG